ncbi:hypothetical protein QA601_15430 [Chitinispirillales bacterium ANBcel5]|nr:hypothetical protein [Chitinispirillales bacterium ANBcel5]
MTIRTIDYNGESGVEYISIEDALTYCDVDFETCLSFFSAFAFMAGTRYY